MHKSRERKIKRREKHKEGITWQERARGRERDTEEENGTLALPFPVPKGIQEWWGSGGALGPGVFGLNPTLPFSSLSI